MMQAASHSTLSDLVTGHLTALVRDAAAVNRHSRRGGRVSAAGGPASAKRRRLVHQDDVNLALSWRGDDVLHVGSAPPTSSPSGDGGEGTEGTKTSRRVDLNEYLRSDMGGIVPPSELGMTVRWLAVEGVSPADPKAGGGDVTPALLLGDLGDGGRARGGPGDGEDDGRESIRIRELQHRLLSEELRLYYSRVTSAVSSPDDPDGTAAALRSVASDTGIQELVPFLSRFVSSGLGSRRNLVRTEYCRRLVRLFDAMLDNRGVHLDLHLHQMLTPVSTCVVARKLSDGPRGDHWALRNEAGAALVKACRRYGGQYATMKPRVVRLLATQALRHDRPRATQYGGICALGMFGPRAVDAFLLPAARGYWVRWEEEMDELSGSGPTPGGRGDAASKATKMNELSMCQQAMLDAMRVFLQEVSPAEQAGRVDGESLSDVFGERLIPMLPERSDYMLSVL